VAPRLRGVRDQALMRHGYCGAHTESPMPLFEYRCAKCSTEFERLVAPSQRDAPQKCANPKCESTETKKLVSRTSFSLKGGGWASDGYSE